MEHQKSTINQNPSNNPNDNNNASSSGTRGAISKEEKEVKKVECFNFFYNINCDFLKGEINHNAMSLIIKNFVKDISKWLTYKEILAAEKKAIAEVEKWREKVISDFQTQKKTEKLQVSTVEGKAVIKAEISQELTAIKTSFENIKISETSEAEIKSKVRKTVERLFKDKEFLPPLTFAFGSVKKEPIQEAIEERVKRLVKNATTDLEKQKNKVVKKVNALIKAREEEVVQAQKVIQDQTTLIEEGKKKYQALEKQKNEEIEGLKQFSDQEISKLQEEIGKLNNQLKDFQEKKTNFEKLVKAEMEEASKTEPTIRPTLGEETSKISKLKKEIGTLKVAVKFFEDDRDHTKLELKHEKEISKTSETNLKNQLKRETIRLNNIITDKQDELERERKIFLDKQKQLNEEIKQVKRERDQIRADWDEEESEIEELRAKNQILKREKADLENKKSELEETIKGLQPSYAYQLAEKFGIIKLKNLAVNACVIIVLIGGLYVISLVLKYLVKPTYKNVKSVFGSNKKAPTIGHEEAEEEGEEEENVFEVEEKPKLPKKAKVLQSNTKVKPKSNTKKKK